MLTPKHCGAWQQALVRMHTTNNRHKANRHKVACVATQVNEVQPGQVVVTDAPTNTKKNVEFGTCIWTTGIKMHPLVGKLAKTLPQGLSAPSLFPLDP